MKLVRLDDLYRMTAYIYSEQNAIRPVTATLSHFVEAAVQALMLKLRCE